MIAILAAGSHNQYAYSTYMEYLAEVPRTQALTHLSIDYVATAGRGQVRMSVSSQRYAHIYYFSMPMSRICNYKSMIPRVKSTITFWELV